MMRETSIFEEIQQILKKKELNREDIIMLLSAKDKESMLLLQKKAYNIMKENCGEKVYYRGLLEFSNICINNCYYCGIRKSNKNLSRFILTKEEIIDTAGWCAESGYGSVVLQSGERRDDEFINFVEEVVREIKEKTKSSILPKGLGITLCVGEQTYETYKRFFKAGAHRYLLRIETTSHELFKELHPKEQTLEKRKECLKMLKEIGYQVGTGVMIELPGQKIEELADDILFFKEYDVDMIGMGPYIVHSNTPLNVYDKENKQKKKEIFNLALRMIAVTRIVLKDVNIASTTALQALEPYGREKGLEYGANVIMPLVTPSSVRKHYQLYDGKPCINEQASECKNCLTSRINAINRQVGFNEWGDSVHFLKKSKKSSRGRTC